MGAGYSLDVWIEEYGGWSYVGEGPTVSTEMDGVFSEFFMIELFSTGLFYDVPPPIPEPVNIKVKVLLDDCEQVFEIPFDAVEVEATGRQWMELDLGSIVVPPCRE